jgi:hypothetical protein
MKQQIINVAFRGVCDRFTRPGTAGAIRQAYLRGVAALIDDRDDCSLPRVLAIVGDPAVNRLGCPVYVTASALPSVGMPPSVVDRPDTFAILRGEPSSAWTVWRWTGLGWTPAGGYVPATASIDGLSAVSCERLAAPVVLYEAPTVVAMLGERGLIGELDEEQLQQAVRSYAGPGATIARVRNLDALEDGHARGEAA